MTILDTILAHKHKEVAVKKEAFPLSILVKTPLYERETTSLATALKNSGTGIIAEYKRRSPSRSVINEHSLVQEVARGYEQAGACGMSILTDTHFFGGALTDLLLAREVVRFPLLRKEFIIDPYQIHEAKAYGADAILLIAAALSPQQIKQFSETAKSVGLDVLLEVHNEEELKRSLFPSVDMLGVNNRNLNTFEVSIETSKKLSEHIPPQFVKVSESGISSVDTVQQLRDYGYQGFLMGENFMKTEHPGASAQTFITQLV